jgi:hypothetical protein
VGADLVLTEASMASFTLAILLEWACHRLTSAAVLTAARLPRFSCFVLATCWEATTAWMKARSDRYTPIIGCRISRGYGGETTAGLVVNAGHGHDLAYLNGDCSMAILVETDPTNFLFGPRSRLNKGQHRFNG